jgi:hypothetical protein
MGAVDAARSRHAALVAAVDLHLRAGRPNQASFDRMARASFDRMTRAPFDRMTRAPFDRMTGAPMTRSTRGPGVCFGRVSASAACAI